MKMPDTINGKTPEEIKKGLDLCANGGRCSPCPYDSKGVAMKRPHFPCFEDLKRDALAYIQQLESHLAQADRERDAAVHDLAEGRNCADCKHYYDSVLNEPCSSCIEDEETKKNWQWRGICPEEDPHGR